MNLLLFPEDQYAEYHHIVQLPEIVSESEHAQMEAKLSESVASAKVLLRPRRIDHCQHTKADVGPETRPQCL